MIKAKTMRFYTDPGHGWVRVRKADLVELGIADKITRYSYQRNEYAYLEEDKDMATYFEALAKQGNYDFSYLGSLLRIASTDRQSKIRNYESYSHTA